MKKFLAVSAIALAMSSPMAFAQSGNSGSGSGNSSATTGTTTPSTTAAPTTSTTMSEGGQQFTSDDERMMYTDNSTMMAPFFTDNTMSTMKSDAEVKETFAAMDAESQAGMKSACEKAMENRGSYGTVTNALCAQVMAN